MKTSCIIGLSLVLLLSGLSIQPAAAETLYRDTPYKKFVAGGKKWLAEGDEKTQAKYVGEVKNGIPNGQGTLNFPGGDHYTGGFKAGRFDGIGTYIDADGSRKTGEWRGGSYDGGSKI